MKTILLLLPLLFLLSCEPRNEYSEGDMTAVADSLLDAWHKAAANADTLTYFGLMDSTMVYIGTDPSERWTLDGFREYIMPFFRQGRGWEFIAVERNLRPLGNGDLLLFDENLDTWMGPCLSTGLMRKDGDSWKLLHYHLAYTVPNKDIWDVIALVKERNSGD